MATVCVGPKVLVATLDEVRYENCTFLISLHFCKAGLIVVRNADDGEGAFYYQIQPMMPSKLVGFASTPGGNSIAVGYHSGEIHILACEANEIKPITVEEVGLANLSCLQFSTKGNYLLLGFSDHDYVLIVDPKRAFRRIGQFPTPGHVLSIRVSPFNFETTEVWVTSNISGSSSALTTVKLPLVISKDFYVPHASPPFLLNEIKIQRTAITVPHIVHDIIPTALKGRIIAADDYNLYDCNVNDTHVDVVREHVVRNIRGHSTWKQTLGKDYIATFSSDGSLSLRFSDTDSLGHPSLNFVHHPDSGGVADAVFTPDASKYVCTDVTSRQLTLF